MKTPVSIGPSHVGLLAESSPWRNSDDFVSGHIGTVVYGLCRAQLSQSNSTDLSVGARGQWGGKHTAIRLATTPLSARARPRSGHLADVMELTRKVGRLLSIPGDNSASCQLSESRDGSSIGQA